MSNKDFSKLKRERYVMPDFISEALREKELFDAYNNRPPYQQNDYIGWIIRAKRQETKEKRLSQMLDELGRGNVYMKMSYQSKGLPRRSRQAKTGG